jgi:hypothetical protein
LSRCGWSRSLAGGIYTSNLILHTISAVTTHHTKWHAFIFFFFCVAGNCRLNAPATRTRRSLCAPADTENCTIRMSKSPRGLCGNLFLYNEKRKYPIPAKPFTSPASYGTVGDRRGARTSPLCILTSPPLFIAREELLTETKTCPPHHTTPVGHRQQERERATRQTDPKN